MPTFKKSGVCNNRPVDPTGDYYSDYGLNWVEFYASGSNRVITVRGLNSGNTDPPSDRTVWEFSQKSRSRFLKYLLNLNISDDYVTLFATLTYPRECKLDVILTRQKYQLMIKRLLQQFSREGIDVISKTEFHRDNYPHLHLILIIKKTILIEGNYDWYDTDLNSVNIDLLRLWITRIWFHVTDLYIGYKPDIFTCQKWINHGVLVSPIQDWTECCYYIAKYTSDNNNKEVYQNLIPYNWIGIRFTNKSLRNYGKDIKGKEKSYYIDDFVFAKLVEQYKDAMKRKYGGKKIDYKFKNGFFCTGIRDYILDNNLGERGVLYPSGDRITYPAVEKFYKKTGD